MFTVAELQSIFSTHRHYRQFIVSGSAQLQASDWAARIPGLSGARSVKKFIDTNNFFLSEVYGGNAKISYHSGYYCHKTRRYIKPTVSINKV